MGMLRPSAKVVILRARPFSSKSSKTLIMSRAGLSSGAGKGYSRDMVTQRRPFESKAMFMGFWRSGSAATSSILNPGASLKDLACSAAGRGSVGRTPSEKGSTGAAEARMRLALNALRKVNRDFIARNVAREGRGNKLEDFG